MAFKRITGTSFTKFRWFIHKAPFINNTLFPPFREMLYAGHVKLFVKVSRLFMHAMVKVVICKNSIPRVRSISGGQKDVSQSVLNQEGREDVG